MFCRTQLLLLVLFITGVLPAATAQTAPLGGRTPVLYIIGDSTVRNGVKGLEGWGDAIAPYFDASRIRIVNRAIGGRSSRSYLTEGRWAAVRALLKPGDFVLMQFGHNDGGPVEHGTGRASLKGNGSQTVTITHAKTGKKEVVHTYGWYMRKYITDTEARGAIPIVVSPIPRNMWHGSRVNRNNRDYGLWAAEAAHQTGAWFINLNRIIARFYNAMGPIFVKHLFPGDHTHTSPIGAALNADCVVQGIRVLLGCPLQAYLLKEIGAKY